MGEPATTKDLHEMILKNANTDLNITIPVNTLAHLIWYSESIGVKRICDKHAQLIKEMRDRASATRYHNMANAIICKAYQIYDGCYADADEFGNWETNM